MYKLFIKKTNNSHEFLNKVLEKYHCNNDIFYNEYGKPYLKNKRLYFNISHSGDYTAIVIADKEVGLDIQKITYKERVIRKCFTEDEKKKCHNSNDFTKIWVKKESYVKCKGMGYSYGLKNVDTTKIRGFKLRKYKDYYISICFDVI